LGLPPYALLVYTPKRAFVKKIIFGELGLGVERKLNYGYAIFGPGIHPIGRLIYFVNRLGINYYTMKINMLLTFRPK